MALKTGIFYYPSVYHILFKRRHHEGDIAIMGVDGSTLTYGRLRRHVKETVDALNDMGYGKNDRIVIVMPNGPEMAVAVVSIAAGFTVVPLNPAYSGSEFDDYMKLIKPKAVITLEGDNSPILEVARSAHIPLIELTPLHGEGAGLFKLQGERGPGNSKIGFAEPEDNAYILLTSGTTARSKMIVTQQSDVCKIGLIQYLLSPPRQKSLNVMPLFHLNGIATLFWAMTLNNTFIGTPGFSVPAFFQWAERYRPQSMSAVPAIYQAILNASIKDSSLSLPSSFLLFYSGGAALTAKTAIEFEKKFGFKIINIYGMTEVPSVVSWPLFFKKDKPGSAGKVRRGITIATIDDQGNFLPAGAEGELVIRRITPITGYVDDPEANKHAFLEGWFRTGDVGYVDKDHYLFVTGRVKEMINCGGEKIVPMEVEDVLLRHPAVQEAVVFPVSSKALGEEVGAAVVLQEGQTMTAEEMRRYAQEYLAYFKVPTKIAFISEIPKGATGKYQRVQLAEKLGILDNTRNGAIPPHSEGPLNDLERHLQKIWESVLCTSPIRVDDDFFDMGGTSIQNAELFSRIEKELRVKLPLSAVFSAPTIRQMAGMIKCNEIVEEWSPIVTLREGNGQAPLFVVHTIGAQLIKYDLLIKHLDPDIPIYGLQPRGLNGIDKPLSTIEDMATYFIPSIRSVRPHGPYRLLGYSAAGTVAYEIARQLETLGETTDFLGIIDTPAPKTGFGDVKKSIDWRFANILLREIPHLAKILVYMNTDDKVKLLKRVFKFFSRRVSDKLPHTPLTFESDAPAWMKDILMNADSTRREVIVAFLKAMDNYVPGHYGGHLTLFLAFSDSNSKYLYKLHDPTMGWNKLAKGGVKSVVLHGEHDRMLDVPEVIGLAQEIGHYMDEPMKADKIYVSNVDIIKKEAIP